MKAALFDSDPVAAAQESFEQDTVEMRKIFDEWDEDKKVALTKI